jgi:hypothetical protein
LNASPAVAYDCSASTFSRATLKTEYLLGAGLLRTLPNHELGVYVNDAYWSRLTHPAKEGLAEQISCAVAGAGKTLASFEFRSLNSGRSVGKWSFGSLTEE